MSLQAVVAAVPPPYFSAPRRAEDRARRARRASPRARCLKKPGAPARAAARVHVGRGLSSRQSRPRSATFAASPGTSLPCRNAPRARSASASTNQKPALWRVRSYSGAGIAEPDDESDLVHLCIMQTPHRSSRRGVCCGLAASDAFLLVTSCRRPCLFRRPCLRPPSACCRLVVGLRSGSPPAPACCGRRHVGRGSPRPRRLPLPRRARDHDRRDHGVLALASAMLRRPRAAAVDRCIECRPQVRQVDLDELRQVLRQARDLELVHHVVHDAARVLHAAAISALMKCSGTACGSSCPRRRAGSRRACTALLERDACWTVAQQAPAAFSVPTSSVEDRRVEGFAASAGARASLWSSSMALPPCRRRRRCRHLARATQAAARTRSLLLARLGFDGDFR